jgi:ATP-dependent Clp protease ATP-binding subunit ClpC
MFERWTADARQVLNLAQEESRKLGHNYIGTEHILLGLQAEGGNLADTALMTFNITIERTRTEVLRRVGRGDDTLQVQEKVPLTFKTKRLFDQALREALSLGHTYVGPEHLLLGMIRVPDCVGNWTLVGLGAEEADVKTTVVGLMSDSERSIALSIARYSEDFWSGLEKAKHAAEMLQRFATFSPEETRIIKDVHLARARAKAEKKI